MADIKAVIKELADWDINCFPLGGGNMINLLVAHGFVSGDDALAMYREALKEAGETGDAPPSLATDVGPQEPVNERMFGKNHDDDIPF